jgi:hypothetical protein
MDQQIFCKRTPRSAPQITQNLKVFLPEDFKVNKVAYNTMVLKK